jgi:hypothetical protein
MARAADDDVAPGRIAIREGSHVILGGTQKMARPGFSRAA